MIRTRRPNDDTARITPIRTNLLIQGAVSPTFDEIKRVAQQYFLTSPGDTSHDDDHDQALATLDELSEEGRGGLCCYAKASAGVCDSGDTRRAHHPGDAADGHAQMDIDGPIGARCVSVENPCQCHDDLGILRDLSVTMEKEIQSFEAANFDPLTGLTNRSGLLALGEEMLNISRSADEGVAVLFVDLDGMRPINERFGREAGDQALQDLARILEGNFRASDLVARVGGDEFCVVMAPYVGENESFLVTNRVQQAIDAYNESADVPWALGINIGGARYEPGMRFELLLALADARMIEARSHRRSQRH